MVPIPTKNGSRFCFFFFAPFLVCFDVPFLAGSFLKYCIDVSPKKAAKPIKPAARNNNSSVPKALTNGLRFIPIIITANDPPPAMILNKRLACCGSNESPAKVQNRIKLMPTTISTQIYTTGMTNPVIRG